MDSSLPYTYCPLSLWKNQLLLIARYAWMSSEQGTRKVPVPFSDEIRQDPAVHDEVRAISLLVADSYLLKPFDTRTTHVS